MATYEFDLVVSGLDLDAQEEALVDFEAQVDDMTLAAHGSTVTAAVERAARSLGEAIQSAIADVEALPGVRVQRVLPNGYVSQVEIAVRTGRTRQSISQLVNGTRGPGGFPAPAFGSGHAALWRWSEVAAWLTDVGLGVPGDMERQAVIDAANAMLDARRAVTVLPSEDQAAIRSLVA